MVPLAVTQVFPVVTLNVELSPLVNSILPGTVGKFVIGVWDAVITDPVVETFPLPPPPDPVFIVWAWVDPSPKWNVITFDTTEDET